MDKIVTANRKVKAGPALPAGTADIFVSFFSGDGLDGFGLPSLQLTYNWSMPKSSVPFFGDCLTDADRAALEGDSYSATVALKRILHATWNESGEKRLQLARWVIADWGGVRRNAERTLQRYVRMAENPIQRTPIKGVASYSKLLSVAHPDRYAIYDARVAVALNAVQVLMGGERAVFPYLPGRNKITGDTANNRGFSRLEAYSSKRLASQGWTVIAPRHGYQSYLSLLTAVQDRLPSRPPLHDLEMTLFSQATTLALKAMAADEPRPAAG